MAQFILAGKTNVLRLLQRGLITPVPEANRHVTYTTAYLPEIVPLLWGKEVVVANCYDDKVLPAAAEILFIKNMARLIQDGRDRSVCKQPELQAQAGDFIVILGHQRYNWQQGRVESMTDTLRGHPVQLLYVGSELPKSVAHYYRRYDWNTVSVGSPADFNALLTKHGTLKLSVFDLARCCDSIADAEKAQQLFFAGQSHMAFAEIARRNDYGIAEHFLGKAVRQVFRQHGLTEVTYKDHVRPFTAAFNLLG